MHIAALLTALALVNSALGIAVTEISASATEHTEKRAVQGEMGRAERNLQERAHGLPLPLIHAAAAHNDPRFVSPPPPPTTQCEHDCIPYGKRDILFGIETIAERYTDKSSEHTHRRRKL